MALKKRTKPTSKEIDNIANELADKPYGQENEKNLSRTTITLPSSLLFELEDMARVNKRKSKPLKSVSAIIRYYLETHFKSNI